MSGTTSSGGASGSNGSGGNGSGGRGWNGPDIDVDEEAGVSPPGEGTVVMDPDEAHPPGKVMEMAAAAVRHVLATAKMEPDFSFESLALVDYYVKEARSAVAERPETLPLTAHAIGAYLGEVVRRRHRCWWRISHKDPGAWRLEFGQVYLAFYPVQVAHTALTMTEEEDAFGGLELEAGDRAALIQRLEQVPPMSEDAYFSPTTRLEVVDIAVDSLLAQRARDPENARPYVPTDYEQP